MQTQIRNPLTLTHSPVSGEWRRIRRVSGDPVSGSRIRRALTILVTVVVLLLSSVEAGFAQQDSGPPRLIIRVDDMGFAHSGNEAILKTCTEGIATSVEIIVPSPWFPEAARMLAEHPDIDVGVHLALSSEWDNIKWRPLTPAETLRDPDGYFFPMIFPNKNYPGRALSEQAWQLADIEREFRAQIELAKKHLPHVSHVSGHMGCSHLSPEVREMTRRLADEFGLIAEPQVKGIGFTGPHRTLDEKKTAFLKSLDTLQAGETYLFVEHPGFDTPELRAIHHIGYENVAEDRQGVTDLLTDPAIRTAIDDRGIRLISYRDVKP